MKPNKWMEKQRMSDSTLSFPIGQTTQVIQLSMLNVLHICLSKLGGLACYPLGILWKREPYKPSNEGMLRWTIVVMLGSGICGLWNTSRVIMRLCGPGYCECTIDSFPSLKRGNEEIPQWKKQLVVGNEVLYFSFPTLSLLILSSLPWVQFGNSCKG